MLDNKVLEYCTEQLLNVVEFDGSWKERLSVSFSLALRWNQPATEAALSKHLQGMKWVNVIVHDVVYFSEHPHLSHLLNPVLRDADVALCLNFYFFFKKKIILNKFPHFSFPAQ